MRPIRSLGIGAWVAALLIVVFGCGGGGGGSSHSNPFVGSYIATFSRSTDTVLLVAVSSDGTTEAVVSDANGVVVQGTGVTDASGGVSVNMNGTAGATTMTGLFSRAPGLGADLSGGVAGSNLQAGKTGNGTNSVFAGKFKIQYGGSSTGELNIVVSNDRRVYKRVGTQQTQIGTISPGGVVTFGGAGLVSPPTAETQWTGNIFLTPGSMGGSGAWQDPNDASFHGSWTAVPDNSGATPVFHQVTLVKGIGLSFPSVFAASPNGHMAGQAGSSAVYWANQTADPIVLNNASGTDISWPTAVNESGTTVGYAYLASQGVGNSKAVVWPAGSTNPVELQYPDQYVSGIASGINSSGVIVGLVRKANGQTRACIWTSASDVGIIPPQGDAVSIANSGVILSAANEGYLPSPSASSMTSLAPPPGYGPRDAQLMGANGIIVGVAQLGADGISRPVAWNPTSYAPQVLAFVAGYLSIEPFAAGNNGTFVGRGKAPSLPFQAFYWKNANEIALLDDLIENNVNTYNGGLYIFADGSVLAYGRDPSNAPITAWLRP